MTQKELAVTCLETLNIYKPYIRKFKSKTTIPCFFENFAGFYADQEPKLFQKIREVEQCYYCTVYAITHEITDCGEVWSMLCVPEDITDVEDVLSVCDTSSNSFYAYAYAWNTSYEEFSEFGDIVVQSYGGGIRRVFS